MKINKNLKNKVFQRGMQMILAAFASLTLAACVSEEERSLLPAGGSDFRSTVEGKAGDDDKRFNIRLELAEMYYQDGTSPQVALTEVDRALELRPRSARANSLKGMIYDQIGDSGNALKYLRIAASIEPDNADYQNNVGVALCNYAQYSEGIQYLERAAGMSNNLNKGRSWTAVGVCYKDAGNVQKAEAAFHQALSIDPRNRAVLYQLAEFMFMRNDVNGAKYYLSQLGSINNLTAEALWLGVKIAKQEGDAYLMSQYANRLRERYPNSTQAAALNRGDYNS